jgi:hypothetical protein
MSTSALTITEQAVSLQTDIKGQLEAFFANLPELTVGVNMLDALTVQAKAIKVTDGKSYTDATEQVQALNSSVEDIEDLYKPFADALYRAHRTVTGLRATNLAGATAEVKRLKFEREQFAAEQERQRREAALKAQREAFEQEQARFIEEARQAAVAGDSVAAEAILEEAMNVEVPPVVLPSTTPQIAGTSFRSKMEWELVDWTKLKQEFIQVNEKAIGATVRGSGKAAETIVGAGAIRVWNRQIVIDR